MRVLDGIQGSVVGSISTLVPAVLHGAGDRCAGGQRAAVDDLLLLQSMVFVAVLAAYGGGLGNRLGLAEIALLAITTWALTVLLAAWMSRRGHRGPGAAAPPHLPR